MIIDSGTLESKLAMLTYHALFESLSFSVEHEGLGFAYKEELHTLDVKLEGEFVPEQGFDMNCTYLDITCHDSEGNEIPVEFTETNEEIIKNIERYLL